MQSEKDLSMQEVTEVKQKVDGVQRELRACQVELDRAGAELTMQRARTQEMVATWKARLEDAEERLRRQRRQRDQELSQITSQLLFFETQLKKEQSEIKAMIAEKNRVIACQRQRILELTAANAQLAEAMARARQRLLAQAILGTGLLASPGVPLPQTPADPDVSWDIANEIFDVDKKPLPPATGYFRATYRPPTFGSQESFHESPNQMQRSRSLPLLDDEEEEDSRARECVERRLPDVLPSREWSRSVEMLNETPCRPPPVARGRGRSAYHPRGHVDPTSPIISMRAGITPPNDLSGAERRDRRGFARLRHAKKTPRVSETPPGKKSFFSFAL